MTPRIPKPQACAHPGAPTRSPMLFPISQYLTKMTPHHFGTQDSIFNCGPHVPLIIIIIERGIRQKQT